MEGTTALVFILLGGCLVAMAAIIVRGMVDVTRIRAQAGQPAETVPVRRRT